MHESGRMRVAEKLRELVASELAAVPVERHEELQNVETELRVPPFLSGDRCEQLAALGRTALGSPRAGHFGGKPFADAAVDPALANELSHVLIVESVWAERQPRKTLDAPVIARSHLEAIGRMSGFLCCSRDGIAQKR